jgi:hypothetical protein
MLRQAADHIAASLPDGAEVLQVGGNDDVFDRATTVITDVAPEVRGRARWVVRDVCDREPWPFADGRFAFAVCTSLATVRDPVGVCAELSRVAVAGYVEVPTIEQELAGGGARWLCDVVDAELVFVHKPGAVFRDPRVRVPQRWHERLGEAERVHGLLWDGRLPARERLADDARLLDDLAERLRRRFEPTSAEVALAEARRLGGLAGAAAIRRLDSLRGR